MKRIVFLLAVVSLCKTMAFGQKQYEMVIEKSDGSEIVVNVKEVISVSFRERGSSPEGNDTAFTTCPDSNHPHMIDLGLPSGTKWACCNVGASAPEEYGNYYAWGETQPKSVYDWDTYEWGSNWYQLTKYITNSSYGTVDNDTTLDAQDDAATANWGAPWRMPSQSQIQELLSSTTPTRTTQNGVNGQRFTGPNGGTIFLPAAGGRWDSDLGGAGSYGYYWSSTLYENGPSHAYYLSFYGGHAFWDGNYRDYGLSVRPVR